MKSPGFEALLNDQYLWPAAYTFKFILRKDHIDLLKTSIDLTKAELVVKDSKNGNYLSVSYKKVVLSSTEVMEIYKKVSVIPDIITL
jgi:hypothetical protein